MEFKAPQIRKGGSKVYTTICFPAIAYPIFGAYIESTLQTNLM